MNDQAAFDALQARLVPLWRSLQGINTDPQTIVVVPTVDIDVDLPATVLQAFEERYLFLLLLLRQPQARMIYVTGQPIHPDIVDYYLDLLPGVISSHARKRLFLESPMEATFRPLAAKILERPRLIERIRSLIIDPERAHLIPFMTTWADRELAMRLEIPIYGADPKDAALGTKTSSRRLFAEAGVPHPAGRDGLRTRGELVSSIVAMRAADPALRSIVIKHNQGVSGYGNAIVELSGLPTPGDPGETSAIDAVLDRIPIALEGITPDHYFATFEHEGGVVEERIVADEIRSPSAQLRITPLGEVELLSTHDQVLGGASGQVFLGSRFPADLGYAAQISAYSLAIGERLAERGVIGRFAIDFVAARRGEGWEAQAIEINLRKGGTTHPFLTLQFLTDGSYDAETGLFTTPSGHHKFYVASDHVESPALRRFAPHDVLEIALMRGLHFDQVTQVGSVFHMLSALPAHGQLGVTCVGNSPEHAQELYEETTTVLLEEAAADG